MMRVLPCAVAILQFGCAIHYVDSDSGVEHVFGFGYIKNKRIPASEDRLAIIRGITMVGASITSGPDGVSVHAGVSINERVDVLSDNTSICLERPTSSSLLDLRLPPAGQCKLFRDKEN